MDSALYKQSYNKESIHKKNVNINFNSKFNYGKLY